MFINLLITANKPALIPVLGLGHGKETSTGRLIPTLSRQQRPKAIPTILHKFLLLRFGPNQKCIFQQSHKWIFKTGHHYPDPQEKEIPPNYQFRKGIVQ
jgi:hypothetical protein